jgi:hypothetical protein
MGIIYIITDKYVINRSYFHCNRQIVPVIHKSRNTGSVIEIIGINQHKIDIIYTSVQIVFIDQNKQVEKEIA